MLRQAMAGLAMLLVTALPGAGQVTSHPPDAVRVVRSPGLSDLAGLDVTITDGQRVTGLYGDVVGLPAPASGRYVCPLDLGVVYHLTFTRHGLAVLRSDVQGTGCRFASLQPGGSRTTLRDGAFWDRLDGALGVSTQALVPRLNGR